MLGENNQSVEFVYNLQLIVSEGKKPSVLIVEDEEIYLELWGGYISHIERHFPSVKIDVAESVDEVRALISDKGRYDIVLTDNNLPCSKLSPINPNAHKVKEVCDGCGYFAVVTNGTTSSVVGDARERVFKKSNFFQSLAMLLRESRLPLVGHELRLPSKFTRPVNPNSPRRMGKLSI